MLKILQFITEINFFHNDKLVDVDDYYDRILSNMSITDKIEYIESLIYRLSEDREYVDLVKREQLDKVIKCANKELTRLRRDL